MGAGWKLGPIIWLKKDDVDPQDAPQAIGLSHFIDFGPVAIPAIWCLSSLLCPIHYFIRSMDDKHLHHPLLPLDSSTTSAASAAAVPTTTHVVDPTSNNKSISSNFGIAPRLILVITVGVVSICANHEASRGFMITIINDVKNTSVGEKFSLFYISTDEATRLVQNASNFATKVLYPDTNSIPEKLIDWVVIQLGNHNSTRDHLNSEEPFDQKNKYILTVSPVVMEFPDFRYRIRKEIRGMAEIMLFDRRNNAPLTLVDGMVEYISKLAGFGDPKPVSKSRGLRGKCWEAKNPKVVANFLAYYEEKSKGFIGRLNKAMTDGWDEAIFDRLLEIPAKSMCQLFDLSMMKNKPEDSTSSSSIYTYR